MNFPKKTTALVLAGGVALASAAYGIGTQAGGGAAAAGDRGAPGDWRDGDRPGVWHRGPGQRFDDLAADLGVDAGELEDALRDFHERQHADRADRFATALADALGKPAEEVRAALDELRTDGRARFAKRIAGELGIDASKVEAALDELEDERPRDPFGFAEALAGKLGLDTEDVEDALAQLRPDRPGRPHRHMAAPLSGLASALDVTRGELRDALREMRAGLRSGWEDRRDELVEFLAQRFGLSEDKVEEALPELPGPGPRPGPSPGPGPHGPPGP
jgi:hypothetical protein